MPQLRVGNRRETADVADDGKAVLADELHHGRIPVDRDYACALGLERADEAAPDSLGCAGDHDAVIGKPAHRRSPRDPPNEPARSRLWRTGSTMNWAFSAAPVPS